MLRPHILSAIAKKDNVPLPTNATSQHLLELREIVYRYHCRESQVPCIKIGIGSAVARGVGVQRGHPEPYKRLESEQAWANVKNAPSPPSNMPWIT
jgi:hypothetical protein